MTPEDPVTEVLRVTGPEVAAGGARGVRVWVATATHHDDDPTIVVAASPEGVLVDDAPAGMALTMGDGRHATLVLTEPAEPGEPADAARPAAVRATAGSPRVVRLTLGSVERREHDGIAVREVVVDGWRVVVESEPEARAGLRERARQGRSERVVGGPVHVRAIIPGRIVALNVAPGDDVTAGQQLLVLEAMKMQNELRAPRDGTIDRVAVAVGVDVEVGDLLLVIG